MADGIEGAAAAFAEDLGATSQVRNRPAPRGGDDGSREETDGHVERILNPTQEREVEPGGGDPEFEDNDGDDDVDGDVEGSSGRDGKGRFVPKDKKVVQKDTPKVGSVEDILDDPLDEDDSEDGGESNGDGNDEGGRRPVALNPQDRETEVEVTVDGVKQKVKLGEALDGYIRQETFHRRLTEHDKTVKAVRQQIAQIDEGRDVYISKLTSLQQQLDSMTPAEPDWEKRFAENPAQAGQELQQWNKYKATREAMEADRQAEIRKGTEARNRAFQEFVIDERNKFALAHPEYTNPTDGARRWERDRTDMKSTAMSHGFTEEEVNNVVDSRYMDVLLKASKYDRLMKRAKTLKPTQSGVRNDGGASRTPSKSNNSRRKLSNTGSISDAASVFAAELAREA